MELGCRVDWPWVVVFCPAFLLRPFYEHAFHTGGVLSGSQARGVGSCCVCSWKEWCFDDGAGLRTLSLFFRYQITGGQLIAFPTLPPPDNGQHTEHLLRQETLLFVDWYVSCFSPFSFVFACTICLGRRLFIWITSLESPRGEARQGSHWSSLIVFVCPLLSSCCFRLHHVMVASPWVGHRHQNKYRKN